MIIRCWGSRGSIAVSGKEYLKYGGDTTCIEIRNKNNELIIIDAGSGIRKLGNNLVSEPLRDFSIIFTHAHWDHLCGFPFFKPIYIKGYHIDLYGCPFAQDSVKRMIAGQMTAPYFPVEFEDIQAEITSHHIGENKFSMRSLDITPIFLSHPNQGMGYRFEEDGKSFVFLTDNELTYKHPGGRDYKDYVAFSQDADLVMHDAEYKTEQYKTSKTWGHSVFTDALQLALDANAKMFGLFHHNQDRSDDDLDSMVDECRRIIKKHKSSLECFAVRSDMEIKL